MSFWNEVARRLFGPNANLFEEMEKAAKEINEKIRREAYTKKWGIKYIAVERYYDPRRN